MIARRADANQPAIVAALRQAGATVTCTHELGHGFPDLVIGFRGQNYMLEVKLPQGQLTPCELRWYESWQGEVIVVHDEWEALAAIGAV